MSILRSERMVQEINCIVNQYLSWITQLIRALAQFEVPVLDLANRWPSSENQIFNISSLSDRNTKYPSIY